MSLCVHAFFGYKLGPDAHGQDRDRFVPNFGLV